MTVNDVESVIEYIYSVEDRYAAPAVIANCYIKITAHRYKY